MRCWRWHRCQTEPMIDLRLGDCLEVLATLEAASVDAVITDPPYCSGGFSEAQKKQATHQGLRSETILEGKERWFTSDAMTTNGFLFLMRSIANESMRVLVDGGSMLCFCDWRMYPMLAGALESSGLRLQNMVVWDKGCSGLGRGFRPQHELIVHLVKGVGQYYSNSGTNCYTSKRVSSSTRQHPTQKPTQLLTELIKVVTPPGGLVLDPFMGSGSTGVAAVAGGYSFIGIEREPEFLQTARKRIEAPASVQEYLFA